MSQIQVRQIQVKKFGEDLWQQEFWQLGQFIFSTPEGAGSPDRGCTAESQEKEAYRDWSKRKDRRQWERYLLAGSL